MLCLFIILSLLNGALLSFQQVMNAALGVLVGSMGSSVINHLVGTLFAGLLLLVGLRTGLFVFADIPFVYFLGGCLGVCTVAMGNYAIPRIGVVAMAILFMSSQLFTSSLIDHFGWFGAKSISLTLPHVVGILLLIVGAALVFTKEKSKAIPPIPQKIFSEIVP